MLVKVLFRNCIKRFYKKSTKWSFFEKWSFSIDHSSTEKENILNIHEFKLISLHEV